MTSKRKLIKDLKELKEEVATLREVVDTLYNAIFDDEDEPMISSYPVADRLTAKEKSIAFYDPENSEYN